MDKYNLSLPAETIDELLTWLDDKQGIIIKQTDLLSGTGQSTTATMTQKAITDALGTKADASNVYTKTQADTLLNAKADKSTTYTKTETDDLIAPLATKEDMEAVEQEVAQVAGEAGLAEAVIDTDGAGTEQEFTFRKSGGDGGAYYRKIKGKTIVVDNQLASNDAEAVETTGANQWDEEWINGYWDNSGFHADARFIASKSKIAVIPGETYYFKSPAVRFEVIAYDANGDYVQYIGSTISNTQFIVPSSVHYITFNPTLINEQTTYNHDICINLSNPAINGQYFPYWKRTLQLGITTRKDTDGNVPFADGMKGAGTAADWADKVGGEKRMGRINLGDLNWAYNDVDGMPCFETGDIQNIKTTDYIALGNIICQNYSNTSWGNNRTQAGFDKTIALGGSAISIRDATFGSDAAAFKAAMNGVMLDYELATPVPFTWAEPLNLGVKVDENGTERAVAPEGATAPSAPFVADTTYTMSVARMVEILKNL